MKIQTLNHNKQGKLAASSFARILSTSLLLASFVSTSSHAMENLDNKVVRLRNVQTKGMLDAKQNTTVYTHEDNGGDNQRWTIRKIGNAYKLRNVQTSGVLDAKQNTTVYTHEDNGGDNQRWVIRKKGNAYKLKNSETNGVLDAKQNTTVYTHGDNGSNNQRWEILFN